TTTVRLSHGATPEPDGLVPTPPPAPAEDVDEVVNPFSADWDRTSWSMPAGWGGGWNCRTASPTPTSRTSNPTDRRMIATPNANRNPSRTRLGAQSNSPAIPPHDVAVLRRDDTETRAGTLQFPWHVGRFTDQAGYRSLPRSPVHLASKSAFVCCHIWWSHSPLQTTACGKAWKLQSPNVDKCAGRWGK